MGSPLSNITRVLRKREELDTKTDTQREREQAVKTAVMLPQAKEI